MPNNKRQGHQPQLQAATHNTTLTRWALLVVVVALLVGILITALTPPSSQQDETSAHEQKQQQQHGVSAAEARVQAALHSLDPYSERYQLLHRLTFPHSLPLEPIDASALRGAEEDFAAEAIQQEVPHLFQSTPVSAFSQILPSPPSPPNSLSFILILIGRR